MADSSPKLPLDVRVGPAGWSYADWNGRVYPERPGLDRLAWIARFFDLVEINVSFYRVPAARTAEGWVRRVDEHPRFRFTAKLPQSLTHGPSEPEESVLRRFGDFLAPLREAGRLGPLLAQFPWSFRPGIEALDRMQALRDALGPDPLVHELRHGGWNRDGWPARLRERGLARVSVDQPQVGDAVALEPAAGPVGYLRVHGRNRATWFARDAGRDARYDYLYPPAEVEQLAQVARTLGERSATYVVTNNHFRGQAVLNALEIREVLGLGAPEVPAPLWREFPEAAARARDRGWNPEPVEGPEEDPPRQGELFG